MKFMSQNLQNLRELYTNQLHVMLSMERQIVENLPTLIEKSTDQQLKQALQSHLQETERQVTSIAELLRQATGHADMIKCKVAGALYAEAEDMILDAKDDAVRDVAIIAAAQRMEHYEIAVYGAVRRFAQLLGETNAAEVLDRIVKEEGHADYLLTEIADRVNPQAKRAA